MAEKHISRLYLETARQWFKNAASKKMSAFQHLNNDFNLSSHVNNVIWTQDLAFISPGVASAELLWK